MAQETRQGQSDKGLFFSKLDRLAGNVREFAVMKYASPERTLLKILLDDQTQFTAEIATPRFKDALKGGTAIDILFYGLFTKDKITGDISIGEIMHDASPADERLRTFFRLNKDPAYGENPPLGISAGGAVFGNRDGNKFRIAITDTSDYNMSGVYELTFTEEKRKDGKGRDAVVVKMHKGEYFMARPPISLRPSIHAANKKPA